MALCKHLSFMCRILSNSVVSKINKIPLSITPRILSTPTFMSSSNLHTSTPRQKTAQDCLMEFFDDKNNWGQNEVRVGRAWTLNDLRIKSNSDLHKLWFVLLKERNMLKTMDEECKDKYEYFANPERLDKVDISMENLETVVRERNKAYYELETGEDGERPSAEAVNCFGLRYRYRKTQHLIEEKFNRKYRLLRDTIRKTDDRLFVKNFKLHYNEKLFLRRRHERIQTLNHVSDLFMRFPNMDLEAVKKEYPEVDIEEARSRPRARGNRENRY